MNANDLRLMLLLAAMEFLSFGEKMKLKGTFSTADDILGLNREDIEKIIGRHTKAAFNTENLRLLVEMSLNMIARKNIRAVSVEENGYPAMLRTMNDPPAIFFYRGSLNVLEKKCISVVGTRKACGECAGATLAFCRDAASDGMGIVSGLAYGIDSFAHKGALSSGKDASTAAILPCGIDTAVPSGNRHLAEMILCSGGCVASEYLPGTPAEGWRFVQRNRLIAALSPKTVVMQAPDNSGALITASMALDYNRDVFVHGAAFCEEASAMKGRGAKKNNVSLKSFVDDGARVFDSYKGFLECEGLPPGEGGLQLNLGL